MTAAPLYQPLKTEVTLLSSQVSGDQNPTPTGQQALDADSYLDPSVLDSSLLTLSGLTEVKVPRGSGQGELVRDGGAVTAAAVDHTEALSSPSRPLLGKGRMTCFWKMLKGEAA